MAHQKELKGIAKTRNIVEFLKLYQALEGRNPNVPGIGLLVGEAGIGKTTSISWLQNQTNCIVVECSPVWTPYAMLADIAFELGEPTTGGAQAVMNRIVERFKTSGKGLILDETDDRLFVSGRKYHQMVDLLRAIHDRTKNPLVFCGYRKMEVTIARFPQLDGRVSQLVRFERLDLDDTELFVRAICPELKLSADLLTGLFKATEGRPRQTVTAVEHIRAAAASEGWKEVTASLWGDRKFFPGDRR
jgi:DNA transposition AAA+ family ATPase